MKRNARSQKSIKHDYTIFAITAVAVDGGDPLVFVDTTQQTDLNAVLRYHSRRKTYASPVFDEGSDVKIHKLATIHATPREVYRAVLAYMRYFLEQNYDLVAHYKPYESCLDLTSETQKIYDQILSRPFDSALNDAPANIIPVQAGADYDVRGPLDARLSVRLTQKEHLAFQTFCQTCGITQRDAVLALLSHTTAAKDILMNRIQEQAQVIETLRQRIQDLTRRVKDGPRGANADKKLISALTFCKSGIHRYLDLKYGGAEGVNTVRCYSWNRFCELCSDWKTYSFPAENGFFPFQLEYLCYGKNRCVFMFGRNIETDEQVRLRFFEKREYIGPHPSRSSYFNEGTSFLVGCQRNADGASDMLFAMPLDVFSTQANTLTDQENEQALTDILRDAERRSNSYVCI